MQGFSRFSGLILCISLLYSCGFHLRGQYEIPESLQYIHIAGKVSVQLREALTEQLTAAGVNVIDDFPNTPKAVLLLEDEKFSKKINTLASNGQVNDYNLEYQVVFSISSSDEVPKDRRVVINKQLVQIRQILYVNQQTILASSDEERTFRHEMEQELARRILFRIQALTKRQAEIN